MAKYGALRGIDIPMHKKSNQEIKNLYRFLCEGHQIGKPTPAHKRYAEKIKQEAIKRGLAEPPTEG